MAKAAAPQLPPTPQEATNPQEPQTPTTIETLRKNRPAPWDQFPDLDLYMDQLLNYVNRQQPFPEEETALTKSMVNNYIKQEIITRPNGKRYKQEHIAQLTMLSLLKEILPIQDCQALFQEVGLYEHTKKTYEAFLVSLDDALTNTADLLAKAADSTPGNNTDPTASSKLGTTALQFALFSYASRRVAMALLDEAKNLTTTEPETASSKPDTK